MDANNLSNVLKIAEGVHPLQGWAKTWILEAGFQESWIDVCPECQKRLFIIWPVFMDKIVLGPKELIGANHTFRLKAGARLQKIFPELQQSNTLGGYSICAPCGIKRANERSLPKKARKKMHKMKND